MRKLTLMQYYNLFYILLVVPIMAFVKKQNKTKQKLGQDPIQDNILHLPLVSL